MSVLGGPFIGTDVLDKLIFSFSPEESGLARSDIYSRVDPFPIPKKSFNVTTSSLSPFYNPPTYPNDGWWSRDKSKIFNPEISSYAPEQIPSSHYTSFLNGNTAFNEIKYTIPHNVNTTFLQDGITVSGFIYVDRFPVISYTTKKKLGVSRVVVSKDTNVRVGVRRELDGEKFSIGLHVSFMKNLRFSICTDYLYDVGKWYFYSAHFRYIDDAAGTVHGHIAVNGEPVTTHFSSTFAFFNRKVATNPILDKGSGTSVGQSYPVKPGFLNGNDILATGNRTIYHQYSIVNGSFQCNESNIKGDNIGNVQATGLLSNAAFIKIRFLELYKNHGGASGLHDNIRLGQHFLLNGYNLDMKTLYNSYKVLYL
jgi:hypothetical protein